MDTTSGKLLKSYTDPSFEVSTYRVRSALTAKDAFAVSGSEDGYVYAWDVLGGERVARVQHEEGDLSIAPTRASRKVVSAVACKRKGGEWASAGGEGKSGEICFKHMSPSPRKFANTIFFRRQVQSLCGAEMANLEVLRWRDLVWCLAGVPCRCRDAKFVQQIHVLHAVVILPGFSHLEVAEEDIESEYRTHVQQHRLSEGSCSNSR